VEEVVVREKPSPEIVLRNGRILVGSLVVGLTIFIAVVVAVIAPLDGASFTTTSPLWLFTLGALAVAVLLSLTVVRSLAVSRLRRLHSAQEHSPADVAAGFFNMSLVRAALLEGLGMFFCVVYMMAGEGLGLVMALGCVVGLLWICPTADRWQDFLEAVTQPS
jgi:hypothetical protein